MINRSGISGAALVNSNGMARDALQERRHRPPSSGRPLQWLAKSPPRKLAGRARRGDGSLRCTGSQPGSSLSVRMGTTFRLVFMKPSIKCLVFQGIY